MTKKTFNMDADNMATVNGYTDRELVFIHNYTTLLERLVHGLGKPYRAIWRTFFHDVLPFSNYMDSRKLPNDSVPRTELYELPSGVKKNVKLNLDISIKPDEENGKAIREAAIRSLMMLDDTQIKKLVE